MENPVDLPEGVRVTEVAHHLVECLGVIADCRPGLVAEHLEVVVRVELFENPQVVLKVRNRLGHIVRLVSYAALVRGHALFGNPVFVQDSPVLSNLVRLQIGEDRFANANVVRGCVVVQLLVPLLPEVALETVLLVAVLDVQDFVTHPLSVA